MKTTTFSASVYGELGRYPLYICRHVRIINYWIKIINTENFIVKTIYNTMLNDAYIYIFADFVPGTANQETHI